MLINQFNGGENSRSAPQMLAQNEGAVYINIDESKGTLCSVKDKLATDIQTAQFSQFYSAGNRFISFPIFTSFAEYNNDLIYCNKAGSGRVRGNNSYKLGIVPPATLGVVTATNVPAAVTGVTAKSASAGSNTALPDVPILYALVNVSGNARSLAFVFTSNVNGTVSIQSTGTSEVDKTTDVVASHTTYRTITLSNVVGTIGSSGAEVYRFYKGKWRQIGILTSYTSSIEDNTYVISGAARVLTDADFSNLVGTYQYLITFYNSATGAESGASPLSSEYAFASGGSVTFTNLPQSSEADKIRIYRVGGSLSAFALVKQLDMGTTEFTDTIADKNIDGRILNSADFLPAPEGMTYIEESSGMLFGAVGSTVRFTPVGKPDAWPAAYEIQFGTDVVGLAEVASGILVFTVTSSYLLTGTGPTTIAKQLVDSKRGCTSAASIQKIAGGAAIWVSAEGICVSTGGPAEVISRAKLGNINIDARSSAVYGDVYYCLDANNITYAFSMAYGNIFKRLKLDIDSLVTGNNTLYGWKDGYLYELFASNEYLKFEYLSPRFIEGRATEIKAYKKFYFFGNGDIIINIVIDDETVVENAQLTAGDTTVIQPPQDEQRGHYVQFAIAGKGELLEYEYEAARRD